jgi:hypothetical protein
LSIVPERWHGIPVSEASCTARIAGPENLAAALQVHSGSGNSVPGYPSELRSRTWVRMMAADDLAVYLAQVDSRPVGTATMMTNLTVGCAPTAFSEAVVVDAAYRRQGVATKIMEES